MFRGRKVYNLNKISVDIRKNDMGAMEISISQIVQFFHPAFLM